MLRRFLGEIDSLAAMAAAEDDGYRPSTGSDDSAIRMHRGSGGGRAPSSGAEMLDELESCLRRWMAAKRPRAARLGLLARPISEAASWLQFNMTYYSEDPDIAGKFLDDIRMWHSRLIRRTKSGPALVAKPLPCPRCPGKNMTLIQEVGSDFVKCTECNRHISVEEYEKMAADAAESSAAGSVPKDAAPRKRRSVA